MLFQQLQNLGNPSVLKHTINDSQQAWLFKQKCSLFRRLYTVQYILDVVISSSFVDKPL